jgi:hypothetical protein
LKQASYADGCALAEQPPNAGLAAHPLRRELTALLVLTFLFPVVACLVFWPTPAVDIREHINA